MLASYPSHLGSHVTSLDVGVPTTVKVEELSNAGMIGGNPRMPRCPAGSDTVLQSRHPLAFVRWRMLRVRQAVFVEW